MFSRIIKPVPTKPSLTTIQQEDNKRLATLFTDLVFNLLGTVEETRNAVYYPIAELVTNIFEHSRQNVGFVFGQFYPKKNYLDICIADRGRGFSRADMIHTKRFMPLVMTKIYFFDNFYYILAKKFFLAQVGRNNKHKRIGLDPFSLFTNPDNLIY